MRLLNTATLSFKDFFDSNIPQYAILSHRWGEQEVSYKELRKGIGAGAGGQGLTKIKECCDLARARGHEWVWIDTCCIDKRSSAELSEAINSMYRWYERAVECYVYMQDVDYCDWELRRLQTLKQMNAKGGGRGVAAWQSLTARFCRSSWFTRGWTLQELLAPRCVIFYDASWAEIGEKQWLAEEIAGATHIDAAFVKGLKGVRSASVAQRMSWASRRTTSRSEDMAYCLFGLFGISLPLLYGEGAAHAFIRLQVEIIRRSKDESIFAWTSDQEFSGLLATEPSFFAGSADVVSSMGRGEGRNRPPYSVTNNGIEFAVPRSHMTTAHPWFPLCLACERESVPGQSIALQFTRYVPSGNQAMRIRCKQMVALMKPEMKVPGGERYPTHLLREDLSDCSVLYVWQNIDDTGM